MNGKNHFHVYRGLESIVRSIAPDVFNVEEEHYSLVTWQCFRIARRLKIPAIFYTWQNIYKRYPPPFSAIEQYVFRHAAAGVAGNQEAADILALKGFKGEVCVIPQMGVDWAAFYAPDLGDVARMARKEQLDLDKGRVWVAMVGRLVPEKGGALLIDALARLPARVCALIVGDGPDAEALATRARDRGVGDRVVFRRSVSSTEVPRILQAVDVLCLPSLTRPNWKEQFGRILVEAMAAGTLVVGSTSGEIPNVVGDTGLVFPEGDASALARVLEHAFENPEMTRVLRQGAQVRAKREYSNQRIAQQFGDLFRRVGERQLATKIQSCIK